MERKIKLRDKRRARKVKRIRKKLLGTAERPRLAVYRSSKQIYVQAVDDLGGRTLAASSSIDKELRAGMSGTKTEVAKKVGEAVARRLVDQGVKQAILDRRWYKYHGRVKALADGAREGGLEF